MLMLQAPCLQARFWHRALPSPLEGDDPSRAIP